MEPSTRRKLWTVGVALVVTLLAAEVACRLLLPDPGHRTDDIALNRLPGLLVSHPSRGYALAADYSGTFSTGGRDIRIRTGAQGLRGARRPPSSPGPLLLAVGDSFTFGFRVEGEEAWPARLEERLRQAGAGPARVLNAGVSGYSLRQIRITAEELTDEFDPDLLLVGIYPGGSWRIKTPYVLFNGQLVMSSVVPHLMERGDGTYLYSGYDRPWLRRGHLHLARWSRFGDYLLRAPHSLAARWRNRPSGPPAEADPAALRRRLGPLLAELDRLVAEARRRRLPLFVVLVNPQFRDGSFTAEQRALNRVVGEHLEASGVAYLDPLPRLHRAAAGKLILRFADDHHWTAQAHAVVGSAVAEAVLAPSSPWPGASPTPDAAVD